VRDGKLEAGDVVYGWNSHTITTHKIDRVTSTMAFSGRLKFDIGLSGHFVHAKGKSRHVFGCTTYYFGNNHVIEKYNHREALLGVSRINLSLLPTEKLLKIIAIAEGKDEQVNG
jgi:hypothetical protein